MSDFERDAEDVIDAVGLALNLLGIAAKLWPALGAWLGNAAAGKTDPLSMRVADVLPPMSESRQVQRELGG